MTSQQNAAYVGPALALWARVCADPGERRAAWIGAPSAPTFVPFDALLNISGIGPINEHLAKRDRIYGAASIDTTPVASWWQDDGVVVIAEALVRHKPPVGEQEARRMILVIAATTGDSPRLVHVTEAVPAVLPLMIETYRRHAAEAGS